MLHDHVEQSEGGDEGADDAVGGGQREDEQHPAVVEAVRVLVQGGFANRGRLSSAPSEAHSDGVHCKEGQK